MNRDEASPGWYSTWANRFLIVSLIGIVYFTIFPFRFDFSVALPGNRSPFLLGPSWKYRNFADFFLNFLLFAPFGFGLAAESRKRSRSWSAGMFLALAGGCFVSYTIEFLQLYIPSRDSGWDDVFSNTLGSVGGFFLFELCGAPIFRQLSRAEDAIESRMSPQSASLLLLIYLGAWFALSIPLQRETFLNNWDTQCPLIIGNDASGQRPWSGQISRVQIWSQALTEKTVGQLTRLDRDAKTDAASDTIAAFEFPAPMRFVDKDGMASSLIWQNGAPFVAVFDHLRLRLDGASWLSTKTPVSDLARKVSQTSEFTLRVICSPADRNQSTGQIASVGKSDDQMDLRLWQIGSTLGFWFRNRLSDDQSALSWYIPGVFSGLEDEDIFITYNGSEAAIYLNGSKLPQSYRLSAGASLAHRFSFIRTVYLPGYEVLYSTFIFLPSGMLIGFVARNHASTTPKRILLASFLIAPPILLELQFAWLGHRGISFSQAFTSLLLALAGLLLINADRRERFPAP